MKKNFAYYWMELHYKDIVPKIIAEKFLCQSNNDLYDYKFMCFNGEVKYFWVDTGRFTHHRRYIFDTQGNFTKTDGDIVMRVLFQNFHRTIKK